MTIKSTIRIIWAIFWAFIPAIFAKKTGIEATWGWIAFWILNGFLQVIFLTMDLYDQRDSDMVRNILKKHSNESKTFFTKKTTSLKIIKLIKITPCKRHAWVETNKGIFRKPIEKVPAGLLK